MVTGVLATDRGSLAFGVRELDTVAPDGRATTWLRSDAGTWTTADLPARAGTQIQAPSRGAAGGSTVVLGGAGGTNLCAHPFGGTSWVDSGAGWQQTPATNDDCVRVPVGIAYGPAGFIEATAATGEVYGFWVSADGLAGTYLPARTTAVGDGILDGGIAADASRYVVVGRGTASEPRAWTSVDGRAWTSLGLVAGQGITPGVPVAGAGRFVIVAIGSQGTVGTWVVENGARSVRSVAADASMSGATIPAGTGTADALVLVGTLAGRPTLWRSTDGATWHAFRLDDGDAEPGAVAIEAGRITVTGTWTDASGATRGIAWTHAWPFAGG